jgi:Family of unknown function (DUF6183)
MAPAAFWRAWSIWAVSVAVTATGLGYTAVHPLPAKLASQAGSAADGVVVVVFVAAFATVGALLAWNRPGSPIGWLLSATGLTYAVGAVGDADTDWFEQVAWDLGLAAVRPGRQRLAVLAATDTD